MKKRLISLMLLWLPFLHIALLRPLLSQFLQSIFVPVKHQAHRVDLQHSAQRKANAQIDTVYRHLAVLVPLILAVGKPDKAGDLMLR